MCHWVDMQISYLQNSKNKWKWGTCDWVSQHQSLLLPWESADLWHHAWDSLESRRATTANWASLNVGVRWGRYITSTPDSYHRTLNWSFKGVSEGLAEQILSRILISVHTEFLFSKESNFKIFRNSRKNNSLYNSGITHKDFIGINIGKINDM